MSALALSGEGQLLEIIEGTLFTLLLFYGCARLWVPFADRLLGTQGALLRCLGVTVLAASFLTLTFHILLAFGLFNRIAVGGVVVAGIAIARLVGFSHRGLVASLERDSASLLRMGSRVKVSPAHFVYAVAGLFAMVTIARALMLPTVGWDSITYHYVKAGMWVQSGGPITLDAPGGWSMYRFIFAGGEIFTAWAMLPFGNDLLAGAVDLFFWACNGLALCALGRELGLRVRHRTALAAYALFLPATWDAVGWGYVDLTNTAFLLIGLVFAIRYLRCRSTPLLLLAILALGLAAGVKLSSVPFLAVTGLILLASVAMREQERGTGFGMLAVGGSVALLITAPWLISNIIDSGYPLRIPMTLAGLQLGADNPAFAWSQDRELAAYTFEAEWRALAALFRLPTVNESHLSVLSLVPLALAPLGFARLIRSRPGLRSSLLLIVCLCAVTLIAFYDKAFSFSRLEFTWVNGRFLMPVVFVALPLAFAALPCAGRWRDVLSGYLLAAVLIHLACFGPVRLTAPSLNIVGVGFLCVVLGVALVALMIRKPLPPIVIGIALVFLVAGAIIGLDRLRDIDRRYLLLANRNVSADVFRYWFQSAHLAEREGGPLRIAVTAGPRQDADNWLMYYFLGTDLQNTLHYVPISTDGKIIPFGPDRRRQDGADPEAWLERLANQRISHVFSFFPSSLEIGWMNERPGRFLRLNGYQDHWGFFRVLDVPVESSPPRRMGQP